MAWAGLYLSGCGVNKYIPEEERLVTAHQIIVNADRADSDIRRLNAQLEAVIDRSPNSRVLGLFRTNLWVHYRLEQSRKNTRFRRFLRGNIAEPPLYVDTVSIEDHLLAMQIFMRNEGFLNVQGHYEVEAHRRRPHARVVYHLEAGRPLRIGSFEIRTLDPALEPLLPALNHRTTLKQGVILKNDTYSREANRITEYLRNNGYAFFYPNQITPLQVDIRDTSSLLVRAHVNLMPPSGQESHQPVSVGTMTLRANLPLRFEPRFDTLYRDIRIQDYSAKPHLRPEVLYRALNMKPDSLYQEALFGKMNRRLSMLGIYRFVNIRTLRDTLEPLVNLDIQLTTMDRKSLEQGIEVNNTTAIGDNSNVLGLSFSGQVTHRNLLRRAINGRFSLEPSVETNLNPVNINAINVSSKLRFQFPFFEDYFRVWEKSHLRRWYPVLFDDARSQVSMSFTYNNLINFWETQFITFNYGFEFNPNPTTRVTLDHFQVDYYRNVLKSGFLDNAPPGSELAFQNQFFTGFLFRSINGQYNAPPNRFGETWGFRGGFEQSGLEILTVNSIARLFDSNIPNWQAGDIRFSKYVRGEGHWTYARSFGRGRKVATRLATGLIVPLADTPNSPYIKQFSVGGPSSMRGWLNGQLGPGSFIQTQTRPPFFQRGDMRLEANVEWRQTIFWILEGAVFVDAGNVWNLRENPEQPGGSVRDMHREWAMASGLGLRLNFQFFVIAYDVGAKIRYPYPIDGSYWAKGLDLNFFNLLIGYPF
jgi:outer membrane protein insertion porin family